MIIWPWRVLKPQTLSVDIAPRSLRSPSATSGFTQATSNSSGLWVATFEKIPVYSSDMILIWRSIANRAEGMLNPIAMPIYDFAQAPLTSGFTERDLWNNGVPFSDGATFSDGGLFETTLINIQTITTDYAIGTSQISVTKTVSNTLQEGQRFSVNFKLYEIKEIVSQNSTTATFKITPNLRETILAGTHLEFDYPTVAMRLATDNEMKLPLNFNKQSFPNIKLIEYL